jgi:molybdopterin-guanine dinucleotide biosynthesis protein A
MKNKRPVYGLIVCGGNSERMGTDKCMLDYHGLPQWQYIFNMLEDLCDAVLISGSQQQQALWPASLPVIADDEQYSGMGPLVALLTAADKYPEVDFLLIGCDYPLLTSVDIRQLIASYHSKEHTAAVWNKEEELYEPLIAVYTLDTVAAAQKLYSDGKRNYSLQFMLQEVNAFKVDLHAENRRSIDTPQQYLAVKQLVRDAALRNDQISEGTVF